MKLIKDILSVLGTGGKKEFVLQFFLMLVAALMEVIGIGSIPIIMRFILESERLKKFPLLYSWLESHDLLPTFDLFLLGAVVILFIFIVKNIYRLFVDYRQVRIVKNVQIALATSLFKKYLSSTFSNFQKKNTSVMIRNIQNEVIYITSKVLVPFFLISLNIAILSGIVISLLVAEPILTMFIMLSLIVLVGFFNYLIKKRLIKYGTILQKERSKQLQYLYQGLQGFKAIKVANREAFFSRLFEKSTKTFANIQQRVSVLNKLPVGYLEVVSIFIIFLMAGTLIKLGYNGTELTYLISFFGIALVKMRQNMSAIMVNFGLIRTNQVSFDPVLEDLHEDAVQEGNKPQTSLIEIYFKSEISFENVSFTYHDDKDYVFNSLSFKIRRGSVTGIVGTTGGGKSTLIDLLLGLHSPKSGEVKVDSIPIAKNITAWQKKIGYVPQSIFLLNASIKENIAFGIKKKNIDDKMVNKVLRLAQLDDFVSTLPDGLDTIVGENGARLSGGQKQRIGIARALYQEPELLILDEATSALDNITEQKFIDMLSSIKNNLTIVMIAHRLSTLKDCDEIFFMEKGEITAKGNYQQLLEKSAGFRDLANSSVN